MTEAETPAEETPEAAAAPEEAAAVAAQVGDGGPTITGGHNRVILQGISDDFRATQSAPAPTEAEAGEQA